MSLRFVVPLLAPVLVAGLLAGCSRPVVTSTVTVHNNADLVATIRAAGKHDDSVVSVEPLRQPGVTHLQAKAQREQANGYYKMAAATLDKALKQSPNAPDLLQDRAELAVRLGHYILAEKLARQSFAAGPKLGSLCARNWQTVLEMRHIAKDTHGAQVARKARTECAKEGPVRM